MYFRGIFTHKKCKTALVVREMQMKVRTGYHFTRIRVETMERRHTFSAGKDAGTGTFLRC